MIPDVIIIGGGLAGLSAAVKLNVAGANVLIVEKNNHLGGRAFSFKDRNTNSIVDNGQHILVGAYKNTFKYLEMIGATNLLIPKNPNNLSFIKNGELLYKFDLPDISTPYNFISGILKINHISMKEKISLINVGNEIRKWSSDFENKVKNISVEKFLNDYKQSQKVKKYFWYPLVVSVMNESPEIASAFLFLKVLKSTYLSHNENYKIFFSSVGQTEIYVDKFTKYFKNTHSNILIGKKVDNILIEGEKVFGVNIGGKLYKSKYVISAVQHYNVLNILPKRYHREKQFIGIKNISDSPIISINLWFDREIFEEQFLGLIDTNIQWVFNRNRIISNSAEKLNYITAVISNAKDQINMNKNQIISIVLEELKNNFPQINKSKLIHSIVIKERRATFSASPKNENYRPDQETEIKNFYLTGDWTNTGYPATIEGAITSGFLCADLLLKNQ